MSHVILNLLAGLKPSLKVGFYVGSQKDLCILGVKTGKREQEETLSM